MEILLQDSAQYFNLCLLKLSFIVKYFTQWVHSYVFADSLCNKVIHICNCFSYLICSPFWHFFSCITSVSFDLSHSLHITTFARFVHWIHVYMQEQTATKYFWAFTQLFVLSQICNWLFPITKMISECIQLIKYISYKLVIFPYIRLKCQKLY